MYNSYNCKLVHLLETEFNPYTRCDASNVMSKLASFVVDPFYEGNSMFLKLYGEVVGPVAETIKRAYRYIVKATEIKPKMVRYHRTGVSQGCPLFRRRVGGVIPGDSY